MARSTNGTPSRRATVGPTTLPPAPYEADNVITGAAAGWTVAAGPATEAAGRVRSSVRRPMPPATMAATPPSTSPHRGPACSPTNPTIGPPTGVDPRNATDHSAITR